MVAVVRAAKLPPSLVAILLPTLVAILPPTLVAILPPTLVAILPPTLVAILHPTLVAIVPPTLVAILPPTPAAILPPTLVAMFPILAAMAPTTTTIVLTTLKIRSNFPSLLAKTVGGHRRRPRLSIRPARLPPIPAPDIVLRDRKRQRRRRQNSRHSCSPVRAIRWNASGCPAPQRFPTSKSKQLIWIYPSCRYRVW